MLGQIYIYTYNLYICVTADRDFLGAVLLRLKRLDRYFVQRIFALYLFVRAAKITWNNNQSFIGSRRENDQFKNIVWVKNLVLPTLRSAQAILGLEILT